VTARRPVEPVPRLSDDPARCQAAKGAFCSQAAHGHFAVEKPPDGTECQQFGWHRHGFQGLLAAPIDRFLDAIAQRGVCASSRPRRDRVLDGLSGTRPNLDHPSRVLLHQPPILVPGGELLQPDVELLAAPFGKLLLSGRELRKVPGASAGTLNRWMSDGTFPAQIHVGSLARWRRTDVGAWIQSRADARARQGLERSGPTVHKKLRGGRSRGASTTQTPVVTESTAPAWEPQPMPLRGIGHRLPAGVPEPVAPDTVS
jgi:predicted DNA-binding transcriptional regulator AlpA